MSQTIGQEINASNKQCKQIEQRQQFCGNKMINILSNFYIQN